MSTLCACVPLSILHLNIRSVNKHHDEQESLISHKGYCFNIIGCSETWLNDKSFIDILNLEGYVLHYKNRPERIGEGVCLHVHSSMHVKLCHDLVINDNCTDSLFIEVNINKSRNLIVGVIYCPLDTILCTLNSNLDELLMLINRTNNDCILLGDYNIDISKEDSVKNDFINTLNLSTFLHTIT